MRGAFETGVRSGPLLSFWREAERFGFRIPDLNRNTDESEHLPGSLGESLFLHQARHVYEQRQLGARRSALEEVVDYAHEIHSPAYQRIFDTMLLLGEQDGSALGELRRVASSVNLAQDDLRGLCEVNRWGEIIAGDCTDREGADGVGACLTWLLLALWASSARAASVDGPPRVIGCFSSHGPIWKEIDGDIDVYMLHGFLNDIPMLQCSEDLVQMLPNSPRRWMECGLEMIEAAERSLGDRFHNEYGGGVPWPDRAWSVAPGEQLSIRFPKPVKIEDGTLVALGAVECEGKTTLIEFIVREHERENFELQPTPFRYAGSSQLERAELLERRIANSVRAGLGATDLGPRSDVVLSPGRRRDVIGS